MKRYWAVLGAVCVVAFVCAPVLAQDENGTLYDQEGTAADGYDTINAYGQGDASSTTNWKWQTGGGSWTGIYRADGWEEIEETGDSTIDIECDIEMYYTETFDDNVIYFHLGDPFNADQSDKTAIVSGTFTSNNGQYLGISFDGTSKSEADMLKDGNGDYTGEVLNAMVGTVDVLGREMWIDKNDESLGREAFNVKFLMSWDSGSTWNPPVSYGDGASNTVHDTLWWLVADGAKGQYPVQWQVELLCPVGQADGNYHLDPVIVAAPAL